MPNTEKSYTIIGSGRVARHFSHYLSLLDIPHFKWSRKSSSQKQLEEKVERSTHIVVLISDSAIEEFVRRNKLFSERVTVHFSGSLVTPFAHGAHPLMTFTEKLYPLERYLEMPFIIDEGRLRFHDLLPGLKNRHFRIQPELRPLYHALCVISGNFTTILWDRFFEGLERQLGLPAEAAFPYLDQIAENLKDRSLPALTGPLARKDLSTIRSNLRVLEGDPLQKVYHGFLEALNIEIRENS
jgi:predicted short-subunit dehydrogenase-like oxidoreductase (DUF2520 family)